MFLDLLLLFSLLVASLVFRFFFSLYFLQNDRNRCLILGFPVHFHQNHPLRCRNPLLLPRFRLLRSLMFAYSSFSCLVACLLSLVFFSLFFVFWKAMILRFHLLCPLILLIFYFLRNYSSMSFLFLVLSSLLLLLSLFFSLCFCCFHFGNHHYHHYRYSH